MEHIEHRATDRPSSIAPCARPRLVRRGFTLIEMIVVVLIVVLVIALLLPALGGARTASRRAATQTLMSSVTQAVSQFERDHRRMPGYFSPREMGDAANRDRGLSAMQNIMLDLAGGIVADNAQGDIVGPTTNATVRVDVEMIGVARNGSGVYFVPDRRYYIAQDGTGQQEASVQTHRELPSIVDAFGQPLLAWVADDSATRRIREIAHFAEIDSGGDPALFYWNSNAAFLRAAALGRRGIDQRASSNPRFHSLIGFNVPDANRRQSLAGILGNPNYPLRDNGQLVTPAVPTAPRGSFVLHSAGPDGVYFGRGDRGFRQFRVPNDPMAPATGANQVIDFTINFQNLDGNPYFDRQDRRTNIDILNDFDDILAIGGN